MRGLSHSQYNFPMLDRAYLREREPELRNSLIARGWDEKFLDEILALDERRRALIREADDLRARRNELSRAVGEMKKRGEDAAEIMGSVRRVSERLDELERLEKEAEDEFARAWLSLPNIPHESVPRGKDESENIRGHSVGS